MPTPPSEAPSRTPDYLLPPRPASAPAPRPEIPTRVGRYRVERLLGEGGFGRVYLAHDDELHRLVAVKVPQADRARMPGYAETYLGEARILARLDHPNIVPVHDVGRTDDGLPFVVSKFIAGSDLAARLRQSRPSFVESAALAAATAEALHHAHRNGLVHRDVKPANILIDGGGRPHVADFGLALREEDFGKGAGLSGTPAYMSPEQARGEGHRVDGRSDVFSLGVVLYELLTGRRPFRGDTASELLEQVASVEPRPPRQVDDGVPKELERICLKALAKRSAERYTTAKDMAEDLRHFLAAAAAGPPSAGPTGPWASGGASHAPTPARPARVVPRGLRCFDAADADFFPDLLPGPRDREGLPEGLAFWKAWAEEADPERAFPVGLLYGPSGCGKSSLVKAGLLPRLAGRVVPVYVEAAAEETEARLLKGLRRSCPNAPSDKDLAATAAALRRGEGLLSGQKVLVILDQFEQWLHARPAGDGVELIQALRQCEGGRLQCLILVRDDFWLAVMRFMQALEFPVLEGRNSALVDLFDPSHARKVLAAFGRAYGGLPDNLGEPSKEQDAFVNQAVEGLAQGGKVISVRLALFAEMVKGKPWTPAVLQQMGGAVGVGATFLEETFASATAPPTHRLHQNAARAVLKALLPEAAGGLKGRLRSANELRRASGYETRPRDFEDLLRILDGELRLITPADPEGAGAAPEDKSSKERYYLLAHDYLVRPLADWLTRKQKETRRGRAELVLAERAALWNARPENRRLPSWWEWLAVRVHTHKRDWTAPQQSMMRAAGRYHAVRGAALALLLTIAVLLALTVAVGLPVTLLLHDERNRAVSAEGDARTAQEDATAARHLAQARAYRFSNQEGQRFKALEELAAAAKHAPSLELRNEAIACLALTDIRPARSWDGWPRDTVFLRMSSDFQSYARSNPHGDISVRRVEDDMETALLLGFGKLAYHFEISPDGRYLAVIYDKEWHVHVWDLRSGRDLWNRQGNLPVFSPDGRRVAFRTDVNTVMLFDAATGAERARLPIAADGSAVAFDPTGRLLACVSGSQNAGVVIAEVETGKHVAEFTHTGSVQAIAWRPDGQFLATACGDNCIYLWDVAAGRQAPSKPTGLIFPFFTNESLHTGIRDAGHPRRLAFNPEGDLLVSCGFDRTIRLWGPLTGWPLLAKDGAQIPASFSADGRLVGTTVTDTQVELWELGNGNPACRTLCGSSTGSQSWCASFHPAGRLLVTAGGDGARLWDRVTGREVAFLPENAMDCARFCPADGSLLTCGRGGLHRWPIRPDAGVEGRIRVGPPQLIGKPDYALHVACCPGEPVAAVNYLRQGKVRIFRLDGVAEPVATEDQPGFVPQSDVALSPDGRWLATSRSEFAVGGTRVYDAHTGRLVRAFTAAEASGHTDLSFSGDCRWLATGVPHEFRLWKVASWEAGPAFPRDHATEEVAPEAFSPDGAVLAVARSTNAIALVDPETGREFASLTPPHSTHLMYLAFSADGSQLAAVCEGSVTLVWDLRYIRAQLGAIGLDWDAPPYPLEKDGETPLRVTVDREGAAH